MTRINQRHIFILIILFVGVALMTSAAIAQSQDIENIFITEEIDTTDFPDVNLTFRAVDGDNSVPSLLTNDDLVVYENEQPVADFEVGEPVNGPVFVVFVVDLGKWANFRGAMADAVRDSMIHFTDGYFRDGIDTVAILGQTAVTETQNTAVLLEPTQSAARFTSAVNSLDLILPGAEQTQGLLGVEAALNRLAELSEPGYAGTAVIYISTLVELPQQSIAERDARTLAAASSEQFTKLYTFHTDNEYGEPLQALASGSGGEYIQLSADHDNSGNLNRVYQSIMAQGIRYPLHYRSQSGDSGPRSVIIAPFGTPAELAPHARSYNISLQPPVIEIQDPEDNTEFTRKATLTDDNSWEYDLDYITITAELTSWPDKIERNIELVTFFVDGLEQHAVENPVGTTFSFNLDISEIKETEALIINVRVRDELDIEAESDSITINVNADTPDGIIPPTATPGPTPTPIVIGQDPCSHNPRSTACVMTYAPWGIAIIMGVVVVVMGAIYRRQAAAMLGAAGGNLRERVAEVRKTLLGGAVKGKVVLAKLQVMVARKDLEGEEVKIYTNKTTIGRSPKLCDVLLYEEDEISSVSGVHCTIQYDRGKFLITDDNSANGTVVNGELLPPNSPRILNHGDEIVLGDLFHRGAKLRFEIVETPHKPSEGAVSSEAPSPEPASTGEGTETILELGEEDYGTLYGDAYDNPADAPPTKDVDWLNDLE